MGDSTQGAPGYLGCHARMSGVARDIRQSRTDPRFGPIHPPRATTKHDNRDMRQWLLLLLAVALVGCGGLKNQIVGTWKVSDIDASTSGSALEKLGSQMAAPLVQGMTLEFSDQGTVKMTHALASVDGTYTIEGGKILTTLKVQGEQTTLKFKLADNDTLETVREFESDPKMVLIRQKP